MMVCYSELSRVLDGARKGEAGSVCVAADIAEDLADLRLASLIRGVTGLAHAVIKGLQFANSVGLEARVLRLDFEGGNWQLCSFRRKNTAIVSCYGRPTREPKVCWFWRLNQDGSLTVCDAMTSRTTGPLGDCGVWKNLVGGELVRSVLEALGRLIGPRWINQGCKGSVAKFLKKIEDDGSIC